MYVSIQHFPSSSNILFWFHLWESKLQTVPALVKYVLVSYPCRRKDLVKGSTPPPPLCPEACLCSIHTTVGLGPFLLSSSVLVRPLMTLYSEFLLFVFLSFFLTFFLSFSLFYSFFLTFFLRFFLSYLLTYFLSFFLSLFVCFFLSTSVGWSTLSFFFLSRRPMQSHLWWINTGISLGNRAGGTATPLSQTYTSPEPKFVNV